jgi:hypothetical protein
MCVFFASVLGVIVLDLCRAVVCDVKINNVDMLVLQWTDGENQVTREMYSRPNDCLQGAHRAGARCGR